MNKHQPCVRLQSAVALLMGLVLSVALGGCSDHDEPAPPPTEVDQAAQEERVVTSDLTPKHYASFAPWQESVTNTAQPIAADVFEFFSYACTHCQSFAPMLDDWAKEQAARVEYVPVIWDDTTGLYASLFYAIRERADFYSLHTGLFEQVAALDDALPPEQRQIRLMQWLQQQGVQPIELLAAMESEANQAALQRIEALMKHFRISSTPTLVLAGQDKIINRELASYEQLLDVAAERLKSHREDAEK